MSDYNYTKLIVSHIGIGFLIFLFPFLSKVYAVVIVVVGLYFIIKNKNKDNEALLAAAYIVGSEVFLRTTAGNPFHEYGKYFVILFIVTGILYSGIPKKMNPYWIYLLLLVPSIIIGLNTLESDVRKKIVFDILGPVCLGICALYTYKRKITHDTLNNILLSLGLPIVAACFFLLFAFPINHTVITNTESNVFLSGNYAPNQMATALGLGTFVFFLRAVCVSASRNIFILNVVLTGCLFYRSLLTFSRGGTATGVVIILLLCFLLYTGSKNKVAIRKKIAVMAVLMPLVFAFGSYQSDSLLLKRYINQNPSGLTKPIEVNGREDMALEEIEFFKKNPVTGVGVGEAKEIRQEKYGVSRSNHSEVTRLLAEHGLFGMASLIILLIFPLLVYYKNKQNFYLLCFFGFWLLTINHSGMRVAAPAFIYALSLINLKNEKAALSST